MQDCEYYCKIPAETGNVTPANAGVQGGKAGFPLEFIPHTMRGGNDKCRLCN